MAGAAWQHAQWQLFDRHEVARYVPREPAPALPWHDKRLNECPRRRPRRCARSQRRSEVGWWRRSSAFATAKHGCPRAASFNSPSMAICSASVRAIECACWVNWVAPPLNPGEFYFAAHARVDRQLVRMQSSSPDCITVVERANPWRPRGVINAVRAAGKRLVREFVESQRAGLAAAILLGARKGITAEETEPYLLAGTVHVLVVSGLNVASLATGFYALMQIGGLSRRAGVILIISFVVLYALVAEAQPPVVRAAVLAIILGVTVWVGRRGAAFNSLAAAAIVVLVINSSELFRVGTQLSFLAMAALIWVGSWSQRWTSFSPPCDLGPCEQLELHSVGPLGWWSRRWLFGLLRCRYC